MKYLISFWETFKKHPIKIAGGIAIISLSVFIFFGGINLKASHGDTKIEISTQIKD